MRNIFRIGSVIGLMVVVFIAGSSIPVAATSVEPAATAIIIQRATKARTYTRSYRDRSGHRVNVDVLYTAKRPGVVCRVKVIINRPGYYANTFRLKPARNPMRSAGLLMTYGKRGPTRVKVTVKTNGRCITGLLAHHR